jgi:hypothetical protein
MDWQLPLVLVCTALAAAYVARRTWLAWSGRKAGCGGCKCAAPKAAAPRADSLISVEELTGRLRAPKP